MFRTIPVLLCIYYKACIFYIICWHTDSFFRSYWSTGHYQCLTVLACPVLFTVPVVPQMYSSVSSHHSPITWFSPSSNLSLIPRNQPLNKCSKTLSSARLCPNSQNITANVSSIYCFQPASLLNLFSFTHWLTFLPPEFCNSV